MSSAPNKRSHEEGGNGNTGGSGTHGHSSAPKFHEDPGAYSGIMSKLTSSTSMDYHHPYDMGLDAQLPKITGTESRDADRRSPLLPVFRVSSSSNDGHSDHLTPESGYEYRDAKDGNKETKVESRDTKVEPRDLYQGTRLDKDAKFESRGDDSKETRHDRESHQEHRVNTRMDKDGYSGTGSQGNWESAAEQHRGKRYADNSTGDLWTASPRSNLHSAAEGVNEASNFEGRDYAEAREAVGENKVDFKGEDKLKEKERKRKEAKHRDWGEREKDRNDRRIIMQACNNSSNENKEPVREEREADRLDKERKDLLREKEQGKDKEREYTKKESGNGAEKGASSNDKEMLDVPSRPAELENPMADLKRLKDTESWKNVDRDPRDKKRERDVDDDGERIDKRNKNHDKEVDEAIVETEGASEKERENFSYGVQQRKRMLRPQGSPQRTNRDPRFRSRNQDNEGSQGKPDTSSVLYRVGECMQELTKVWKEYGLTQTDKMSESSPHGPILDIHIPAEHVSATNHQVRGGQLWGTDIYTDDSDLVAVLMHAGYCRPTTAPPEATIQELRVTIRVLPPEECYISTLRNNVRSRSWGAGIGCSYRVERCCVLKKGGAIFDLQPCLTHSSSMEPTLAPVAAERTMTTRAAASNALRQRRFVREFTVQFNLCGEPWLKYSIGIVADKGLKRLLYTSSRLKKGEVLYLETHCRRYELCFTEQKLVKITSSSTNEADTDRSQYQNSHRVNGDRGSVDGDKILIDAYRWSRCKKIQPQTEILSVGIPLPPEYVEVLADNLDWDDINWTPTGVNIAGVEYSLTRAQFVAPK